ncbi:MAG: nucleoside kinase [Firmicutes bacterium]|nr:nucleoside kinase [Bacillota bacterium]
MKIQLKTSPRGEYRELDIAKGTTLETLYRSLETGLPYTVLAARVQNRLEELTFAVEEPCQIELLDMRTQDANLIYQYSLTLLYIKAVRDCLGPVRVEVQNSLNKGLYTEIKTKENITEAQVRQIEERMRELVAADLPFVKERVSREDAVSILQQAGLEEKHRLLEHAEDIETVDFYTLDDYRDSFFSAMVPSTGYLQHFELKKYRRGVLLRFPHPSEPDRIPDYEDEVKLYQAFSEQTRWDQLLGVNYVADLNEKIESGAYKELIQLSEALHEKKISDIADQIKQERKRIVLIAGPSSSGKTTFAQRLCIQLKVNGLEPLYLGTDDYFVEREETPLDQHGEPDYENLGAVDIELFNRNMNDLLEGREVDLPAFDFLTGHKVFGKRITKINGRQPIVIEGIHGLNEELTAQIPKEEKFKIYISPLTQLNIDGHNRIPTTEERMLRRMVRDYRYRGKAAQTTIDEWPKVRAGEDTNIFPYNGEADVLFNSYHVYEIAVLKKYAEPLLRAVKDTEPSYMTAQRLLDFLQFFRTIEDDHIIVNNSIIREFIGGSIFVE